MIRVPQEVEISTGVRNLVVLHKFSTYHDEGALANGYLVPFNIWCETCQMMCAIDMVQKPGFTKFWCTGETLAGPCKLSITYWSSKLQQF